MMLYIGHRNHANVFMCIFIFGHCIHERVFMYYACTFCSVFSVFDEQILANLWIHERLTNPSLSAPNIKSLKPGVSAKAT